MNVRRRLLPIALTLAAGATLASAGASSPIPLDYKAYNGWSAIATPRLAADGSALAYALVPEDGDPTVVVVDLASGAQHRETRGILPNFVGGARFVVFTHTAPIKDIDAAKLANKPESERPKNGVGILDRSGSAPAEIVDSIKEIAVAHDRGPTIAYLAEPTPMPSRSPGASPEPSPPATPKNKTKPPAGTLTIRNLATSARFEASDVSEVAISDDDRFVAYAVQTRGGDADGVYVYASASGTSARVASGAGRYRKLALAKDGSGLAYLSDAATFAGAAPHDALYVVDLTVPQPAAKLAADTATAGMPAGTSPNANDDVGFSQDGKRVFFGTAAVPTPMPSSTPRTTAVDIWSWNDDVLQSQQKHDADLERKRTYLATYDVASGRFVQLGSLAMRDVAVNENPNVALGQDDRAYRRAQSWLGADYADAYALSLHDGEKRLLARGARDVELSPDGRYIVAWDKDARHWYSVDTAGGRRVELAPHARVRFDLEDDDHPIEPQPYGTGGWLTGDRAVLLYDRYDVWLADPRSGEATDLTRGVGRATRTVFSPLQTDPDARAFAADRPILLSLIDETNFDSGYARVAAQGGTPQILLKTPHVVDGIRKVVGGSLHDLGLAPVKATGADRYAFTMQSFRDYQLYSSDGTFAPKVESDANPQQAHYRWGSERLISYRSADGTPLRGILLVPDGLQRDRKAPMLIYFYETMASTLHLYQRPGPGTEPNLSRYVSNGYVVLLPDVHYRIGHPGKSAFDCIMPAVRVAIATGYVDPSRVGISGHSWAAYQTNYIITKTHFFRAAEAGAAVDDMISAYGGIRLESGWVRESQYEHTQSRIGATPWDRPDLYIENSGLFGIKNITTPYLTIHNDMDGAVPQFQGIEFVTAMRRLGKIAYLFAFDGEEHGLRNRENQKYWTVHLDEWFDYWLKGAPRPSWMNGVDYLHRGERDMTVIYGTP